MNHSLHLVERDPCAMRGKTDHDMYAMHLLADAATCLNLDGLTVAQIARSWICLPTPDRFKEMRSYRSKINEVRRNLR